MMDEFWSRGWAEAHKAALQARKDGRPMPSLWHELRMLVRDLITPPQRQQAEEPYCDAATCQSPVYQSAA